IMSAIKIALQQRQKNGRRKTPESMSADVSPDSKCPICLDIFNNISYLDLCLHKFCFRCIHEWSKNKAECPLCKQPFHSIYHSIKSEQDFKKYDLQPSDNGSFGTFAANEGRPVNSIREPEMINFRRELYRRGVRVRTVRDGGRSRDTSAEFYRRNPACLHRLIPWLKRELTVLYGAHGSLEELRPFLQGRTEHFLHEFISFAKSPFNMEAYDQYAVYECPAPSSNEDSSSNSSVIAISEDEEHSVEPPGDPASTLRHSMWDDETPGPSYSTTAEQNRTEHLPPNQTEVAQGEVNNDECLTSDSDDCIIVGFVKPTAERTPELVQLSSDSDESASEDSKEVPFSAQHIRFSSLSPPASQNCESNGTGQSQNVETDHSRLHSKRPSSSKSSRHKTSSKSNREKSKERHCSKDKDHKRQRRRTSRSKDCRHSSRSPVMSHSSVSTVSKERGYSYSSSRDMYSKYASNYKQRDSDHSYQSYSHYSQERSDSRVHYTERQSYYYSSQKYSDRLSYSRSRSRSRDSWRRDRRHSRSRSFSSSHSPSAKRKSHHDKPGGKRKYKTRHLEEASKNTPSNSHPEGDSSTLSTKHKKKSKEKHHKKSKDQSKKTSRSLSVELINEDDSYERSKRHHKKKKKHKKKSKRHKSNEHREKHPPSVITIDSDSDSDSDSNADDSVTQANGTNKDNPIGNTTDNLEDPTRPDSVA
uniref:E3 ubiquitin-protein ligase Topors n=1 Tax=Anabas testudineus TaxID=64144 RepID=A0A7N6F851_ANATE